MKIIGKTLMADLKNCNKLKNYVTLDSIKELMLEVAKKHNLTVVNTSFHHFEGGGNGITAALILAESHLIIHTYPEYNYVALDIFLCDLNINPKNIMYSFIKEFNSDNFTYSLKERII